MKDCCLREAKRHLKKHRDVARCDECRSLILAYGNERDFCSTVEELEGQGIGYETVRIGELLILAKLP